MAGGRLMKLTKKATLWAAVAWLVVAAYAKRRYKNAKLSWILKRWLGKMLLQVLPIPLPRKITGAGSSSEIGQIVKEFNCRKPLVVTDEMLVKHGIVKKCTDSLDGAQLQHEIFDKVYPNPVAESVEEGYQLYKRSGCDSIIAIGGGSPMDVAKVIAARVANPLTEVLALAGLAKVDPMGNRPIPPLIAVPTTAGTGSETTLVAVVTNAKEQKKVFIAEATLVPKVAVLDPELLVKLPRGITAATGMDALTHAMESYIGGWSTAYTRKQSLAATGAIFKSLLQSYNDGANLEAREAMLNASFTAGTAFTRANVGYVHAIAHQFGGLFHTPHGDANAMLLPHVLEFYIQAEEGASNVPCTERLCELAVVAGLVSRFDRNPTAMRTVARKLVARVAEMNAEMGIPQEVPKMKASDVKTVAVRALNEAHGDNLPFGLEYIFDFGFPVPTYIKSADCEAIISICLPASEKVAWEKVRA